MEYDILSVQKTPGVQGKHLEGADGKLKAGQFKAM